MSLALSQLVHTPVTAASDARQRGGAVTSFS
jgi:hypothetical protein